MLSRNGTKAKTVLFTIGQTVMTPGARDTFTMEELLLCLRRHATGDWGDMDKEDQRQNDAAVRYGNDRVFSAYQLGDRRLWIITEYDRSSTCLLLPEDY